MVDFGILDQKIPPAVRITFFRRASARDAFSLYSLASNFTETPTKKHSITDKPVGSNTCNLITCRRSHICGTHGFADLNAFGRPSPPRVR